MEAPARQQGAMFELHIDGAVARLRLNRSEARNAIPLAGWDALAAQLGEAEVSEARLLIVEGAGEAFCAGADLGDFPTLRADEAARTRFRLAMKAAFDRLAALALPTVARIDGPCYGAGVALAIACDLRLAGPGARFAITPARMGISYPQGDVARLVALIGAGQAARLLFTGSAIDAEEALRIGLAEARLEEEGAIVEAILACDPASHAALKRGLRLAAAGVAEDEGQDAAFDALFGSDALAERLAARARR
jgi:enoyl-CoA hydratase/carnithine racemase